MNKIITAIIINYFIILLYNFFIALSEISFRFFWLPIVELTFLYGFSVFIVNISMRISKYDMSENILFISIAFSIGVLSGILESLTQGRDISLILFILYFTGSIISLFSAKVLIDKKLPIIDKERKG